MQFLLSAMLILAANATEQFTIFNMPSTDVLPEGKVGIRLIGKFKFNDEEAKKKFFAFTPRLI